MRKINLLLLTLLLPIFLFSQGRYENEYYVVDKDWTIASTVTTATLSTVLQDFETVGAWKVRGGYDINKNGRNEIVILMDPTGAVTMVRPDDLCYKVLWLEDDGNGNYEFLWSYTFPYGSDYSYGDVTVADLDKDGNQEIWVTMPVPTSAEPNPPRVFCFEYDPVSGKMPDEPTLIWNIGVPRDNFDIRPTRILIDDVDNDGYNEILITTRNDDYTNGGSSGSGRSLIIAEYYADIEPGSSDLFFGIEYIDTNTYLRGGAIYDISIVDFDGNGKKEIWVWTWNELQVNIFEATAPNTYEHVTSLRAVKPEYGDVTPFEGVNFYDLDGDGKLEGIMVGATGTHGSGHALYPSQSAGRIYYIESTDDVSKLTGDNFIQIGYNVGGDPRGGVLGDFNNNGRIELFFMDRVKRTLMCMEYNGSGSFKDSTSYTWTEVFVDKTPPRASGVTTGPHNGDYWFVTAGGKDAQGFTELLVPNLNLYDASVPSVLVFKAAQTISVEKKTELPEGYNLAQNYPNPFNPSTNIEFSIPKATHVSLKIYNMLGQEVSTLLNEAKEAGSYIAKFDAKNLPSGIYWYTIKADNYSATKKMMLIK